MKQGDRDSSTVTSIGSIGSLDSAAAALVMPVIPLPGMVVFPRSVRNLVISGDGALSALREAVENHRARAIFVAQRTDAASVLNSQCFCEIGTIAQITNVADPLDSNPAEARVLVTGLTRARVKSYVSTNPHYRALASIVVDEELPAEHRVEFDATVAAVRERVARLADLDPDLTDSVPRQLDSYRSSPHLADVIATHSQLTFDDAQAILEATEPLTRLKCLLDGISHRLEILDVKRKLESNVQESVGRLQRQHYLREQMRAIQRELGESDAQSALADQYLERIENVGMTDFASRQALREVERLRVVPAGSPEHGVITNYLDWLCDLPWQKESSADVTMSEARRILDEEHHGLEKVKDRLLEYLAVNRHAQGRARSPILIFVGPPGVGKTSIARAFGKAMGRVTQRLSLGGVRDEAEIRGHRRTYVGALPGRFVHALKMIGVRNRVIVLDEIDKMSHDFRGDPSSALLEVLDPAQNAEFTDHFLEVPIDLSRVTFICTANTLDTIPAALLDRLEVIEVDGYTEEEKLRIAEQFLLAKQLKAQGLRPEEVAISREALLMVIRSYTRESGVRQLERHLAAIIRKAVRRIEENGVRSVAVDGQDVASFLGAPPYLRESAREADEVGVATGVAVTQVGGEILTIEASVFSGKPDILLTGHLGEVMKESAIVALTYIRGEAESLGIDSAEFERRAVAIHVPAGAVPKDGPSAGVAMVTTLVSALTDRPVRRDVAMTGEVTTRGRVLAVGGIREKLLAARRAGIRTFVLPERNRADLAEIPPYLLEGMDIQLVSHVDQVLDLVLVPPS